MLVVFLFPYFKCIKPRVKPSSCSNQWQSSHFTSLPSRLVPGTRRQMDALQVPELTPAAPVLPRGTAIRQPPDAWGPGCCLVDAFMPVKALLLLRGRQNPIWMPSRCMCCAVNMLDAPWLFTPPSCCCLQPKLVALGCVLPCCGLGINFQTVTSS